MNEKYERLLSYLRNLKRAALAFSGGVDSTFLLYAAKEALGDNVVALTVSSCFIPQRELEEAKEYCEKLGVTHVLCETEVLQIEGVAENPKNRCYLCKKAIFSRLKEVAQEYECLALIEGSNVDDAKDYRPGAQAIQELAVRSPLKECGLTKADIRALSKEHNIPTWNKPSFACLASRIPYGERITKEKLSMVEQGEELLLSLGFTQFRVREHEKIARIELLPEEFDKMMQPEVRMLVYDRLKQAGFSYVTLDLFGYRMGSLNEMILPKIEE